MKLPNLVVLAAALTGGTALIGALLAYELHARPTLNGFEVQGLLWAFVLCIFFAGATVLFALSAKKEAA